MLSVLAWLMGSKAGRIASVVGLSLLAVGVALLIAYRKGIEREQLRDVQRSLDTLRKRIAVDDDIAKMSRADRREQLSRWVHDE